MKGTKTEQNLLSAFTLESQASHCYLYFAARAESEGFTDVAAMFRATAKSESSHVEKIIEYLKHSQLPFSNLPVGDTKANLQASVIAEKDKFTNSYPEMAEQARKDGFKEIADWFETLAKSDQMHATRFQRMLDQLSN